MMVFTFARTSPTSLVNRLSMKETATTVSIIRNTLKRDFYHSYGLYLIISYFRPFP